MGKTCPTILRLIERGGCTSCIVHFPRKEKGAKCLVAASGKRGGFQILEEKTAGKARGIYLLGRVRKDPFKKKKKRLGAPCLWYIRRGKKEVKKFSTKKEYLFISRGGKNNQSPFLAKKETRDGLVFFIRAVKKKKKKEPPFSSTRRKEKDLQSRRRILRKKENGRLLYGFAAGERKKKKKKWRRPEKGKKKRDYLLRKEKRK